MTLAALINDLRLLGVKLGDANGRLRVDAPAGVLTDEHRALLTRHKVELLALLTLGVDIAYTPIVGAADTPTSVPPDVYLILEPAQYDHPRWLSEFTGIPLDELLVRLEASPYAAKGRPYRERLGLVARPVGEGAQPGVAPAPDLFPAKGGTS